MWSIFPNESFSKYGIEISINKIVDNSESDLLKENSNIELPSELKEESQNLTSNVDDKLEIYDNDKFDLNIDSMQNLDIKTLDGDPDNLNLDILDLTNSEKNVDSLDDLKLDIEELA